MNGMVRNAATLGVMLSFVVFLCASANAATIYVGTCGPHPGFPTIQQGVNHAAAGPIVRICPGIYPEQVEIAKALTLEGVIAGIANQAIVASPAGGVAANTTSLASGTPIAAQIWVHDTTAVTILNVVVDGANNNLAGCSPNLVGVYFQDASGTINQVATRNQIIVGTSGCQTGLGIFVQSGTSTVTNTVGTHLRRRPDGGKPGDLIAHIPGRWVSERLPHFQHFGA